MTVDQATELLRAYTPIVNNHGHITPEQCRYIFSLVAEEPANLLIFGCGIDSEFWVRSNAGGRTMFVEDIPAWVEVGRKAGGEVCRVRYHSIYNIPMKVVVTPVGAEGLMDIPWKLVLVDAPTGFAHGREQSIYMAAQLRERWGATVFVHDYEREWERTCCDKFLNTPSLTIGNLAVFKKPLKLF
jgi:hypothetical protein